MIPPDAMVPHAALPSLTVAIATTGRPAVTAATLAHLAALSDRPARVVVCIAEAADFDAAAMTAAPFAFEVMQAPRGSCAQRNAVIAAERSAGRDLVLFLDDDFLVADGYMTALLRLFAQHRDVAMATGEVLADGIHGPGLSHAEASAALAAAPPAATTAQPEDVYSVYGCNMALRLALLEPGEGFDERLPRYGWLEDLDLSRRLARRGRIVRDAGLRGVHLGTKAGRSPGRDLGYSQIANPVYLIRKGTMSPRRALRLMAGNIAANTAKTLRPEPWIDRRGRLAGNLAALRDLMRGRLDPGRILRDGR